MQPNFKILVDKADITSLLNGRLLSLSITDEIGLVSDTLTLELDDRDAVLEIPPRGAEVEAFLGYEELYPMGKFIVDEAEIKSPPETMSITSRASNSSFRDMGAFKSPRSYSWEEYTLLGIVQTIAKRYGLTASVADDYKKILISPDFLVIARATRQQNAMPALYLQSRQLSWPLVAMTLKSSAYSSRRHLAKI